MNRNSLQNFMKESLLSDDINSSAETANTKLKKAQCIALSLTIAIETILIVVLVVFLGLFINKSKKENELFYPTEKSNPLFVFCHGVWGTGINCWFPYAFTTISKHDCDFISPDLPNPETPRYEEWKPVLLNRINKKWDKKQPLILVGHSLGGYTVLHLLSDCANETWAKNVKGVYLVSPVVTMKYTPFLDNFTEIDFQPVLSLNTKFRHIYNTRDHVLDPRNSEYLTSLMKEAKADYRVEVSNTKKYDYHFGGFKHYPVKEINDGLESLLNEIDPSL